MRGRELVDDGVGGGVAVRGVVGMVEVDADFAGEELSGGDEGHGYLADWLGCVEGRTGGVGDSHDGCSYQDRGYEGRRDDRPVGDIAGGDLLERWPD